MSKQSLRPASARADQRAQSEDQQQVDQVRTHEDADRQTGAALTRGVDAVGQFRHAGAEGYDRNPSNDRRAPQPQGQTRPAPNQELGSTYEADETGDDQYGV
ncbi:MAG TPA: hypothetical protein VFB74_29330 [Kribbellaceae bacterium]|nr:hypothetical protein [Kribbellaceae bacterium]